VTKLLGTLVLAVAMASGGFSSEAADYAEIVRENPNLKWYAPLQVPGDLPAEGVRGGSPTWTLGPGQEQALVFDGNYHLTWGKRSELEVSEMTVELWFSPGFDSLPYNPCLIAMREDGDHRLTRWSVHVHGDRSAIDLWNGQSVAQFRPPLGSLEKGQWYHLAVSARPDGTQVYVNGVPCLTEDGAWAVTAERLGCPLNLASSQPSGAERFLGAMAYAAIYAGTLQREEIARRVDALGFRDVRLATEEAREHLLAAARAKQAALQETREKRRQELMHDPALFARGEPTVYSGARLTAIDMPVGGIGIGAIHFDGTGRRHAWQIFGNVGYRLLPNSFFAVRVASGGDDAVRVLQAAPQEPLPGMKSVRLKARYPLAEYVFEDDAIPCQISMEVYSPFIPLDTRDSVFPCLIQRFHFRNVSNASTEVQFLAAQQNAVGYRGATPIEGDRNAAFGGNVNRIAHRSGATWLIMENKNHSQSGMVLAVDDPHAAGIPAWEDLGELVSRFSAGHFERNAEEGRAGPSAPGQTLNGALLTSMTLAPGESKVLTVILTWYFSDLPAGQGSWGGTGRKYEALWKSATEVTDEVLTRQDELYALTRLYVDTLYASNLPIWLIDRITNQTAILRSGTVFWTKHDYFGAWEGCNLNSGCCVGNCNHVWHYAQAHARLFPELARLMRQQEFRFQKPDGAIPHRQPDSFSAFDGQCGAVLNSYREHLMSQDDRWLQERWSHIRSAMEYVIHRWDGDENGVPSDAQWNTLDGELGGSSSWLGSLYLAALRAAERMARRMGDEEAADRYHHIFEAGSTEQDRTLFNGRYYIQIPDETPRQDYGEGCGIDQVLGQWWARQLDLGAIYPLDHVRTALTNLFLLNFQGRMEGLPQLPRKFVADDDAGLQMFVWPAGTVPPPKRIQYASEVMTGFEYAAAAAMIQSGLLREGFTVARAVALRYDGRIRQGLSPGDYTSWGFSGNPFGDDECGKFYARAMSSWSLLLACQGAIVDGPAKTLGFLPVWRPEDHASFFTAPTGWGLYRQLQNDQEMTCRMEVRYGFVDLSRFISRLPPKSRAGKVHAMCGDQETTVAASSENDRLICVFPQAVRLEAGQRLTLRVELETQVP